MTLTAGTKLGPYEIPAPLGAGGMVVPIQNTESFQFGTPQPLPMPTADLFGFTPGATPGRFLVLRRAGPPEPSPIHLVLNWSETLKK